MFLVMPSQQPDAMRRLDPHSNSVPKLEPTSIASLLAPLLLVASVPLVLLAIAEPASVVLLVAGALAAETTRRLGTANP